MPVTVSLLLNNRLSQQINSSLNDHQGIKRKLLEVVLSIQRKSRKQECASMQAVPSARTQLIHALNNSNSVDDIIHALSIYQTNLNCLHNLDLDDDTQAFLDQTSYITGVKTTMFFLNGQEYNGQFLAGKMNGHGVFTWPNGWKYVGQFQNGLRHGQGTFTWKNDGAKYIGQFKADQMHGYGVFTWQNGAQYSGQFVADQMHGYGTYTWPDGGKYNGHFQNSLRHGQGTYTWRDGTKYQGQFQYDRRHGEGTYTWLNGTKYKGVFINDESYNGTITWPDGKMQKSSILTFKPLLAE